MIFSSPPPHWGQCTIDDGPRTSLDSLTVRINNRENTAIRTRMLIT
jgi:hypothetical protein